jgi:hypothetical protein
MARSSPNTLMAMFQAAEPAALRQPSENVKRGIELEIQLVRIRAADIRSPRWTELIDDVEVRGHPPVGHRFGKPVEIALELDLDIVVVAGRGGDGLQREAETRPPIYFLHYWGPGPAEKLATGFKAALGETGKSKTAATASRQ